MKIVLASCSPRRAELLKMIGIEDFEIKADKTDEPIFANLTPHEQVSMLALKKAGNVRKLCDEESIIIAADTLVYVGSTALEKPGTRAEASHMIEMLSGRKHTVYTALVIIKGEKQRVAVESTDVYFRDIPQEEAEAYVKTGEPFDKAGGYAAQGLAAVFIEKIEGDFFTVMGLPLCRLVEILKEFGYNFADLI